MKRPHRRLCLGVAAVACAVVPASYTPESGLQAATASCQSGTCCPEPGSLCVIGDWIRKDKYLLAGGGSCITAPAEEQTPTSPGE